MEPAARVSERRGKAGNYNGSSLGEVHHKSPDRIRARYRLLIPSALLVALFLVQGVASGATTVTIHSPARYAVAHAEVPVAPPVALTATGDAPATRPQAALGAAGTQMGVPGMAGSPTALPACVGAVCRDRYIVASPAGLVVGDYAEHATFTVRQPVAPAGVSVGFMVEIMVHTSTGWTVGRAYLATGTTRAAGGSTISLTLYLNLGTAAAPTILSVYSVVDTCTSATVCP
jgi:hypothetical protein